MRSRRLRLSTFWALAVLGAALAISPALAKEPSGDQSSGIAYSIQLQATIDPATQQWISSATRGPTGKICGSCGLCRSKRRMGTSIAVV